MQAFLDFLPVVAFVVAYWLTDLRTAIMVIMAAMVLQVAVTWLLTRTVSRMTLASAALVVVMGAISLRLENAMIFKWKPTLLNWAFALAFLASEFIGNRPLVQRMLESVAKGEIELLAPDWRRLNQMWAAFFVVSGGANLYVAYNFSEQVWVNFKLFGLLGLTLLFVLLQAAWLSRRTAAKTSQTDAQD